MAALGRGEDSGKPFAVISLASYDHINGDLEIIGKAIGNPMLSKTLEAIIASATQGKGLVGLDKARPWGAAFVAGSPDYPAYFFLPVTDLKGLVEALQGALSGSGRGGAPGASGGPAKPGPDGVYEVPTPARPLFAKQKGSWVFVAFSPEGLKSTPDDPLPLLGDLPKKYSVAVKVMAANIPPALREMAFNRLKQITDIKSEAQADEAHLLGQQSGKKFVAMLGTMLDDLDEATVGLAVDATAQKSYLEFTVTAKDGTKMAKQFAENADLKTNYAAFRLPAAALSLSRVQKMPAEMIADYLAQLKTLRERLPSQLEKQGVPELKQAAEGLLDVAEATVKDGRIDIGASVVLDTKAASLVGAIRIVGGDKLDKALHDLAEVAKKKDPDAAKSFKLDIEKAAGVRFHVISLPIPAEAENRDKIVQAVGETLDVAIGIADGALYVAVGHEALATLKKTLEKSVADGPKPASPFSFSLALGAIARFFAEAGDAQSRPMGVMFSALLAQKDQVNVVSTAIPRGIQTRLELEDGVVKAVVTIGQMSAMMGGGRGAGF
jgi:hypothetical protein